MCFLVFDCGRYKNHKSPRFWYQECAVSHLITGDTCCASESPTAFHPSIACPGQGDQKRGSWRKTRAQGGE
eukprot:350135-Rhodomonas_salina.1